MASLRYFICHRSPEYLLHCKVDPIVLLFEVCHYGVINLLQVFVAFHLPVCLVLWNFGDAWLYRGGQTDTDKCQSMNFLCSWKTAYCQCLCASYLYVIDMYIPCFDVQFSPNAFLWSFRYSCKGDPLSSKAMIMVESIVM